MSTAFYQPIVSLARAITNIGVSNRLSVSEKSKVRVLNLGVFAGILINFFFFAVNMLHTKPLLGFIDLILALGGILILFLHKKQQFFFASLILVVGASSLFVVISILYRNGVESGILALMIISVVIFEKRKQAVIVTLFVFILFIIVKIFLVSSIVYDTVPQSRILFNSLWSLFSVTLSLIYLRKEQETHEQKIENNLRELARMNSEKAKIFSIISHDLRSPIGHLKTLIELVNEDQITMDTFKSMTSKLAGEADQLQRDIDNLLQWSISQSQGIQVKPERISISDEFNRAISFVSRIAEIKSIQVLHEAAPAFAWADADHVQLVLRNLVSNAIKYSNPGDTILLRSYPLNSELIIEVMDNGIGIQPDSLELLFTPDHFQSREGTQMEKGTGLGLTLCREFVEKNKGRIWVASEVNKGSTFFVALPLTG